MNKFLDLASTRRSIRKFKDTAIPMEDIEYFINAATSAPSGCNSQCWKFVAIRDRNIINQLETAVIKKAENILEIKRSELSQNYLSSKRKMISFFAKAPLVIAVFMTKADFYDQVFISALKENGYDDDGIMKLFANYDLLSIGAAIQNLLLAIHEKGYGACWMNEPAIAAAEINEILGEPIEHRFISLIPVGIPAYTPQQKKMKDIGEVFSII
jgi:nitroreductase